MFLSKKRVKTLSMMVMMSLASTSFAYAAETVKEKGTATNVAFNKSFEATEWKSEGKPNVLIIGMDDLGYGQLNFDEKAFEKETLAKKVIYDKAN